MNKTGPTIVSSVIQNWISGARLYVEPGNVAFLEKRREIAMQTAKAQRGTCLALREPALSPTMETQRVSNSWRRLPLDVAHTPEPLAWQAVSVVSVALVVFHHDIRWIDLRSSSCKRASRPAAQRRLVAVR
jgi:hypothetical protein